MEDLINQAVANHDYVLLVLSVLLVGVPAGLKLAGKDVPVVDQIVKVLTGLLKGRAKPIVAPPPAEGEKVGLAAVIDIKPETPEKPQ